MSTTATSGHTSGQNSLGVTGMNGVNLGTEAAMAYQERWSQVLDAIVSWENERDRLLQEAEDRAYLEREESLRRLTSDSIPSPPAA